MVNATQYACVWLCISSVYWHINILEDRKRSGVCVCVCLWCLSQNPSQVHIHIVCCIYFVKNSKSSHLHSNCHYLNDCRIKCSHLGSGIILWYNLLEYGRWKAFRVIVFLKDYSPHSTISAPELSLLKVILKELKKNCASTFSLSLANPTVVSFKTIYLHN